MSLVGGITLKGIHAYRVEVEVEVTGGLFSISIVGLPDAAVKEAKERVRAALRSLGLRIRGRVAVNLAPADVPKEGALLDLPIAIGLAEKLGSLVLKGEALFLGELALDGRVRGVRGAVPAALLARDLKVPLFVSSENIPEVALVEGVEAYAVNELQELIGHLRGEGSLERIRKMDPSELEVNAEPDFSDIKGQGAAKRALEIAAAGHHNVLLTGSPGSGKTMLARALRGVLPPLSDEELTEVMLVRSTVGLAFENSRNRPFRAVHHTSSAVAVCGGGTSLRPGEITLAHRGVLFLDEFTEFRRDLLESLRQPVEDGNIVVSRSTGSVTYPSRVLLVAACNPCPCGWKGDPLEPCRCSPTEVERYQKKMSGPILDRIDLYVSVPRLSSRELLGLEGQQGEKSCRIRERVCAARKIQQKRWSSWGYSCNAELPEKLLRKEIPLKGDVRNFLQSIASSLRLSGRGLSRVLRVARTIADLEGSETVAVPHLSEALAYRETGFLS
ncbi:MAG TPA: YifB family Mg chelatase-like AAA ATPase [Synergistales bacterium]|nr:YifB family Mg chelatase-like AAA ATPase [Synergistales bacterium]